MLRKILLFLTTFSPTQKKVALALNLFKISKIAGVTMGIGPSSKVRYMTFCKLFFRHVTLGIKNCISRGVFTQNTICQNLNLKL